MSRLLEDLSYKTLGIVSILGPWLVLTWPVMLVIGNLHHAGVPIRALSYGDTLWMWSPVYFMVTLPVLLLTASKR